MNITKKQIKTVLLAFCLTFPAGFITASRGEIDVSLDDLPLPSPSQLSLNEQQEAISFFESQHQSWLSVQSGTFRYEITVRNIVDGEFVADPNRSQTGTLEFTLAPLNNPVGLQSPAKIQAHLFNDRAEMHFLMNNVFDSETSAHIWTEASTFPDDEQLRELRNWAFKTELFFLPFDFMAKTYSDGLWDNKYTEAKEQFFAGRGLPWRLSTQEETSEIFGGEQQYLFMASAALVDARYWFSSDNSDLRQVDVLLAGDLVKSFRYENYFRKAGTDAKFPQRVVLTRRQGTGDKAIGWEYAVDINDIKLNVDIPPERFIAPQ
jgi:hypothetical protein